MMAVRIYEVLLLHKLLRCRPDIDTERLGLIGHSGGSAVGNLAIRVAPEIFDAYVSDNMTASVAFAGKPFQHFFRSTGWCPPDPHPRFPACPRLVSTRKKYVFAPVRQFS